MGSGDANTARVRARVRVGVRVRPTVTAACAAGARHRIVPSCASDAAAVAAVKRAASAAV